MAVKRKTDERTDPSTTSAAWNFMAPKWAMVETLLGGTQAMRNAQTAYLPRHPEETGNAYDERLQAAVLYNMAELTLDTWVGKPFGEPVKLNDDVPEPISTLLDDIDLQGNNLTVFSRNWFKEGLAKAFAHVVIDFPSLKEEEREGRTKADDDREGRRPYWVMIKPENVIAAFSQIVDGQEILTHVRIREDIVIQDGFAEVVKERIRVMEPGQWFLYELRKEKGKKEEWVVIDNGVTAVQFVPMVTFYANRSGLMTGKPPIEDLAFLNVRHWQSTADQTSILTVARFPMLAVAGASDQTGSVMAIGPKQLLGTKDPQGRFYYVEHSGKAIGSGRTELLDLEEQMASYGADFLKRRPGNMTATSRALDSVEAVSPLQDAIIRFVDAINVALSMTAAWMGMEEGGTVDIQTDFSMGESSETLKTLLETRKNGDISREDFLDRLRTLKVLRDDFDPEENLRRLQQEAGKAGIDPALILRGDFVEEKPNDTKKDDDE
jgi:hypothetical protein